MDGSQIRLPDTEAVRETFGTQRYTKGKTDAMEGEHPYALASVLYDVLNRVALDATLARTDAYEVDVCIDHLVHTRAGNLLVMDRNDPSYRMLAELHRRERDFVIRCSKGSFAPVRRMLGGAGAESQIVTLHPCAQQVVDLRQRALPLALTVRFVRVRLKTGEWEVLITSLLDETCYPAHEFGALYRWHWGVETFYGLLKTRLNLENFSGTQPEAVKQDFFATVYLCDLELRLTQTAQAHLDAKNTRYTQKVSRAVSFNTIKNQALALLMNETNTESLLAPVHKA
ncbi:MAG: IS4 family transposase [Gammaproteobacteria bacterium]|nr:IS4 family transposase [Gammaproteobacteria bacterium]MCP5196525.1 IS4 family transposase [Gammaproteobacteria bacterium]